MIGEENPVMRPVALVKRVLRVLPTFLIMSAPLLFPGAVQAYIGPGAGFAFISSVFVILVTFILASLSILVWPVRFVYRRLKSRNKNPSSVGRVVVLGLDGLSPEIVERKMDEGVLPNFQKLRNTGYYSPLETTNPSISPVAWSSFQTGVNPGKHNIFDFLGRDMRSYSPVLSFSKIRETGKVLRVGKYCFPLSKPRISLLRKSRTFWEILGREGIFSTVLRVPVTFPPEKFHGLMLSAMGAPDLKGSQGTFTYYTSRGEGERAHTGGAQAPVEREGNRVSSYIPGPGNPFRNDVPEMKIPFTLELLPGENAAILHIQGKSMKLMEGEYSPWVRFSFKALPGVKIRGVGRFLILNLAPDFEMYLTPVNIDPEKPAMPISHPLFYSIYLSKLVGEYATLGEAEDTWALNEGVIDEEHFLEQCYMIYHEREKMFFEALKKTRSGVCVCVFDTSDRVQHMFWRPAEKTAQDSGPEGDLCTRAIDELYRNMDVLLGSVLNELKEEDVLFVLSDHGISPFRRCFNLNRWLYENGYLHLTEAENGKEGFFANVDWVRTRAYGVGMAGLYINQKGRESSGIVDPGEEKSLLKAELIEKLTGLKDDKTGQTAVLRVYDTEEIYSGPFRENAPDMIVGCNAGYRIGWDSVIGNQGDEIFEDNNKAWRADHCVDSSLVPGVLFSNKRVGAENPRIWDLAPTVLRLYGAEISPHMDGKDLDVKL